MVPQFGAIFAPQVRQFGVTVWASFVTILAILRRTPAGVFHDVQAAEAREVGCKKAFMGKGDLLDTITMESYQEGR